MARKLRVQYPGAIYHVMSRGNRRERIFVGDQDRRRFLQTLGEACQKTGWQVHAREFERQMEERRRSDHTEWIKKMRRGWYLGDEEFRRELLAQMDGKIGDHDGGPERRESAEQRAESLLNEELNRRGWNRKELKRRRKADPGKVQVAGRLRKETTMNWQWIAASLMMGAADYAAACVRELLKQS
jgi:hypothetical protein